MAGVDRNSWEKRWNSGADQLASRRDVLDQIAEILKTDSQDIAACSERKEAAEWLGERAGEIAAADRLLDASLKALIRTANDKEENSEVRRSARTASQAIWQTGWDEEAYELTESRRPELLRRILVALQEEEDDPEDWRFRRKTTVWLKEHAPDLTQNDSMIDEALEALCQRVLLDTDPSVRREAERAIEAIWSATWAAGGKDARREKRRAVLRLVLQALETDDSQGADAWLIRQMAARWLRARAEEIAADYRMLDQSLELLIATAKKGSEQFDVRRISREASQAIWKAGWDREDGQNIWRPNLLNRILQALIVLEDDPTDWQYRQSTAVWLKRKAKALALDDSMAHKAVEALIARVVDEPNEYVQRCAEEAIMAIWNAEWSAALDNEQQEQLVILDQILEAMAWRRRDDGQANDIGRIAADWLSRNASSIAKDPKSAIKTLGALVDLADYYGGREPEISLSASAASTAIWEAGLPELIQEVDQGTQDEEEPAETPTGGQSANAGGQHIDLQQGQTRILRMIQRTLQRCADPEMRLAANVWFEKAAPGLARLEYQVYRRVADALAATTRDPTASGELKQHAQLTLRALWSHLENEAKRQLELLKEDEETEDRMAKAIYELSDRNTLGSRDMAYNLVRLWVEWIAGNRNPRLVDLTAETIRYNRYAIPALIDAFAAPPTNGSNGQDEESRKRVELRIAKQLADMSDPIFFQDVEEPAEQEKRKAEYAFIRQDMDKLAVPFCIITLAEQGQLVLGANGSGSRASSNGRDEDTTGVAPATEAAASEADRLARMGAEIREHLVRALAYTGGREAVDAIARLVVGRERERQGNRARLDEYYLQPSRERREQAVRILEGSIKESENTLSVLRILNVLVFATGLIAVVIGLRMFLFGEQSWQHWLGFVSAFGGVAGMITLLVWESLDMIQNSTASLVQVEAAFTGFIWQLNLNQTLIQSRYINNGELGDDEIQHTADRVEQAMELTMNLVSTYTKAKEPRVVTRINRLEPAAGGAGQPVTVHGQHLTGDAQTLGPDGRGGMVIINRVPVDACQDPEDWQIDSVKFSLPEGIAPGTVWISLIVNGMETNALPFQVE